MKEILGLLYLGIFCSALAYFFAYEAFKRLDGFINYLLDLSLNNLKYIYVF